MNGWQPDPYTKPEAFFGTYRDAPAYRLERKVTRWERWRDTMGLWAIRAKWTVIGASLVGAAWAFFEACR